MKQISSSESLLIEEVTQASKNIKKTIRGLHIGAFIKSIRIQLGMPQKALAKRAGVLQATISRVEQNPKNVNLSTLQKILNALSCDFVIAPILQDSIDAIRRKQARKIAENHIRYLKGTMHLEDQQPDARFIEKLLNQEEERLLRGPSTRLWED
ncbi:MAG TPA: helix-turn-helix domain-containing protein [Rhabdochlamydiaceae bacterium]|nr:helix-turn-helix domain-containing protein [Rhabdochlamydiaceae bacterium]